MMATVLVTVMMMAIVFISGSNFEGEGESASG